MVTRAVEIELSTCELASEFASLPAGQQALFFHEVALEFASWGTYRRDIQILEISNHIRQCGSAAEFIRLLRAEAP